MRELVAPGRTADVPVRMSPKVENRRVPLAPIAVGLVIAASVACAVVLKPSQEPVETTDAVVRIGGDAFTRWLFPGMNSSLLKDDCVFVLEVHGCSGGNGTVEIWNQRLVDAFYYHGQSDVYLGAIHRTHSLDGVLVWEWWGWFGNVTSDYRAGLWTPSDGIEFRHSENQTFGNAVLVVMYSAPTAIPEFSSVLIPVAAIGVVVMILIRRRR